MKIHKVLGIGMVATIVACSESGTREVPLGPSAPGSTVSLTPPTPESPVGDAQLNTLRPTLVVRNGTSDTQGTRTYEFQISDRSDFSSTVASYIPGLMVVIIRPGIPEGAGGTTSFTPDADLQPTTRMYWRARMTQGAAISEWSATAQFRTRVGGFNRTGELYDPLISQDTIGARTGSTTFMGTRGLRVDNASSFVRYVLATTLTTGFITVDVEGLQPNGPGQKSRIFSMMDGGSSLFNSNYLFNVQYRGLTGNPDNAVSYKVLMGSESLKYEPDFGARSDGIRNFNPNTTYVWTATWGSSFSLTIREGSATGSVVYNRSEATPGLYNPTPHTAYLGANDVAQESGSYAGAIYRHFWVGSQPRPPSLGSALAKR